ncbi:MAG: WecB/TagA/CpsF family glycosyltransferase [Alphaproteobacteria bacterium]|nr:WecB/TagA/CpsF family glycosyltransferase [Alphaproteobacteria bacterium]MBU0796820.1 WecB/TagA/CpsF family glycosyltransferase [Alphaproteobacteria bacterium]MBU0885822.1 WecB/TagA/CpsF family glycosyltransferase [Alphaproteobacteria bacterium]MBU1812101.1 WecB/TagA/CpsF family glycosyltransferase [Alphaproteobacteria bacterium]
MTDPVNRLLPEDGRCRLCGATVDQRRIGQESAVKYGQWLFRCGQCAGAYLAPGLTKAASHRFYAQDYRRLFPIEAARAYDDAYLEQIAARQTGLHRAGMVQAGIPLQGAVLEIGCGTGAFLGQLHRLRPDLQLYGSEIDRRIAGCALDGAPLTWLPPDDYSGRSYDLIALFHVLEHVDDPRTQLSTLRDLLSPGGRIVVEVPDSLAAASRSWKAVHPAHLSYFTARSLDRLAACAGLKEVTESTEQPVPMIPGVIWREWQANPAPAPLPLASAEEVALVDRLLPAPSGSARNRLTGLAKRTALWLLGPERLGPSLRRRAYRQVRKLHARPFAGNRPARKQILGVAIDPLTMDETVHLARRAMRTGTQLVQADVNVAKLFMMQDDPALAEAVNHSDIVSADGMGILLAARFVGADLPERVTGIDLMERVVQLCAEEGFRPFFLGAKPEVVEATLHRFRTRYPALQPAGYHHGYFSPQETPAIVARIAKSGADCLFVGMPSPAKEILLTQHRGALGVAFAMGVGGSFDVVAGLRRRAPIWAQRAGLEWFCRLIQEPRRLGPRYFFSNLRFLGLLLRHRLGGQ